MLDPFDTFVEKMGAAASTAQSALGAQSTSPPEHDPNTLATWTLAHVFAVYKNYRKGHYDFGLHEAEFAELLQGAVAGATSSVASLWRTFDPSGGGIVNILEVLAGLAMVGWAPSAPARIEIMFTLFDCNNNGSISLDELVILLQSAMAATVKLTGTGVVPGSDELEVLAAAAFAAADTDGDASLSRQEFRAWVESGATTPLFAALGLGGKGIGTGLGGDSGRVGRGGPQGAGARSETPAGQADPAVTAEIAPSAVHTATAGHERVLPASTIPPIQGKAVLLEEP